MHVICLRHSRATVEKQSERNDYPQRVGTYQPRGRDLDLYQYSYQTEAPVAAQDPSVRLPLDPLTSV